MIFYLGIIVKNQVDENIRKGMNKSKQWNALISLELVPHPNLKHQEAIALDYVMIDGVKTIQVRAAMAGYLLRLWNVDCSADHHLTGAEYQLWLRKSECLAVAHNALLAPGMS